MMGDNGKKENDRNKSENEKQMQNKGISIKTVGNIPVLKSYTVNNSVTYEKAPYREMLLTIK